MDNKEYRLLPVALHPAIEEALKRYTWMPESAWQDVIAAWDRVKPAVGAVDLLFDPLETLEFCVKGTDCQNMVGINKVLEYLRATSLAAPERSGKTADVRNAALEEAAKACDFHASWSKGEAEDEQHVEPTRKSLRTQQFQAEACAKAIRELKATPSPAASSSAAPSEHYRTAIEIACEGFNMSPDLRKHLEKALFATPSVKAVAAGQEQIFTYAGVTQNIEASRFGEAARRTMQKPGGDSIDTGLQLLLELQNMGYGIVSVPGLSTKPPALAGDAKSGE